GSGVSEIMSIARGLRRWSAGGHRRRVAPHEDALIHEREFEYFDQDIARATVENAGIRRKRQYAPNVDCSVLTYYQRYFAIRHQRPQHSNALGSLVRSFFFHPNNC